MLDLLLEFNIDLVCDSQQQQPSLFSPKKVDVGRLWLCTWKKICKHEKRYVHYFLLVVFLILLLARLRYLHFLSPLTILRWQVLNQIVYELPSEHPLTEARPLRELLGHTPTQVFAGAVLGFAVATFTAMIAGLGSWSSRATDLHFANKFMESKLDLCLWTACAR